MTYEEALKTLEEKYIGIGSNDLFVFRKAAEAINKQIPKKPIEEWTNSPFSEDRGCKFLHLMCPNCKKMEVCKMEYFCPRCGQALDWSDVK